MYSDSTNECKGILIKSYTQNSQLVVLQGDTKEVEITVDGDCCSHSWIEGIDFPDELIGATIRDIEEVYGSRDDSHPEHDTLQVYFLKIHTDKGVVTVDYRNASNGYYGASVNISIRDRKGN